MRFVLVGDDGEHDPEVYDTVRRRYPDRVEAVWIRRVGGDDTPLPAGQRNVADVLAEVYGTSVPTAGSRIVPGERTAFSNVR